MILYNIKHLVGLGKDKEEDLSNIGYAIKLNFIAKDYATNNVTCARYCLQ